MKRLIPVCLFGMLFGCGTPTPDKKMDSAAIQKAVHDPDNWDTAILPVDNYPGQNQGNWGAEIRVYHGPGTAFFVRYVPLEPMPIQTTKKAATKPAVKPEVKPEAKSTGDVKPEEKAKQ